MFNNSEIFVLESNENSAKIIESYLKDANFDYDIRIFTNYSEAFDEIKKNNYNSIIIADSDEYEQNRDVLNSLKLYSSKIIITSSNYSTDSIIRAMRLGAKEFLTKPVLKNDLLRSIRTLIAQDDNKEVKTSKIVTVYSNKGGIGKTTVATNLAAELAKVTQDKVALIDLNLQLGDVSTFLNLTPSFDVNYLVSKLIEKDEDTVIKAFEKYKNTDLYILSAPYYIEHAENITPQKLDNLFESLRKIFQYIVVDMSSNIDANSLKILDQSDLILFTTIVNIPAIRNCQRCLNLFNSRRYSDDKVKVIINRYMENDEIKIEDIETAIDKKVYWRIPNNYFSIMDAINKGVTVGELGLNSNIANSFRDLATKISDDVVQMTLNTYKNK